MKPPELIKILEGLPQDKPILCQIIDQKGNAFGGEFSLQDVPTSWMNHLAITHRELVDLYNIKHAAECRVDNPPEYQTLTYVLRNVVNRVPESVSFSLGREPDRYGVYRLKLVNGQFEVRLTAAPDEPMVMITSQERIEFTDPMQSIDVIVNRIGGRNG